MLFGRVKLQINVVVGVAQLGKKMRCKFKQIKCFNHFLHIVNNLEMFRLKLDKSLFQMVVFGLLPRIMVG